MLSRRVYMRFTGFPMKYTGGGTRSSKDARIVALAIAAAVSVAAPGFAVARTVASFTPAEAHGTSVGGADLTDCTQETIPLHRHLASTDTPAFLGQRLIGRPQERNRRLDPAERPTEEAVSPSPSGTPGVSSGGRADS